MLFTTPPPVRAEELLTGANDSIPPVFKGVVNYTPVQATLSATDLPSPPAISLSTAALAVVQIRRCDNFGCTTPVGSGVIIHPNGLILTAHHVLLTDPDDPTSSRYSDFVIAVTANIRSAPQPLYKARVVAEKVDQDLALLMIDRDQMGNILASAQLQLPVLPLADISNLFGGALPVLGYPVTGGEAIHILAANFSSFDDNGRLIVVNPAPAPGNSGGPAMVEQDGHYAIAGIIIRRRSTEGQLSQDGLVRAIDQLAALTWTPKMVRAWGETVQANTQASDAGDLLRLTLTLNMLDLRTRPLRLFFYATDATANQPWQPTNASAPLVVWADLAPQQAIARQALTLTVPVTSLGTTPDRLRFHALLWDTTQGDTLWADLSDVQTTPSTLASTESSKISSPPTLITTSLPKVTAQSTVTPTSSPAPRLIATPRPTNIPTASPTSTETATSRRTPTPTFTEIPSTSTTTPTKTPTASCYVDGVFSLVWNKYKTQLGCNLDNSQISLITIEAFQGGYLVWTKAEDRIYAIRNDGYWSAYPNSWKEGEDALLCPDAHAYGYPAMGFGKLWCTESTINKSLRMPLGPEKPDGNAQRQIFENGQIFRAYDGKIFILLNNGTALLL